MTNRYHLPVVVTTSDEMTREEAAQYVERIIANLEETDDIYRTFVEDAGIDDAEAERLLQMLSHLDTDSLQAGMEAMAELDEE